jgi:lysophospholipase L1-like esterase
MSNSRLAILSVLVLASVASSVPAQESRSTKAFDLTGYRSTGAKAQFKLGDSEHGKALELKFADDCKSNMIVGRTGGTPEWNKAAGFSFWLKGDGSDHLGALEFIWNDDYGLRYAYTFSLKDTAWRKVAVAWRDLLPEVSNPAAKPIDASANNVPAKLGPIWFGKWWYWRDAAAHSYSIADLRLEASVEIDRSDYKPKGNPLARVATKLKAVQPIKIVTMGDSLTDTHHWSNRELNWPLLLKAALERQYGSKVTIVNPAIGGTELRQNLVLLPEWSRDNGDADLVTICFGGNDWNAGIRGPGFEIDNRDAVELVRRATAGKADVLVMTTCPQAAKWDTLAELAEAGRKAAAETNAGLADIYAAFHAAGDQRDKLLAWDHVHLGRAGQELFAATIMKALEDAEK